MAEDKPPRYPPASRQSRPPAPPAPRPPFPPRHSPPPPPLLLRLRSPLRRRGKARGLAGRAHAPALTGRGPCMRSGHSDGPPAKITRNILFSGPTFPLAWGKSGVPGCPPPFEHGCSACTPSEIQKNSSFPKQGGMPQRVLRQRLVGFWASTADPFQRQI